MENNNSKKGKQLIALVVILVATGICLFSCLFLGPVGNGLVVQPQIQMAAEPLISFSDSVYIPNSFVTTLLTDLVLIVGAVVATRRIRAGEDALVPKGAQNVAEWIVESLSGLAEGVLGEKAMPLFPLLATFFLFILVANWMELFPGFDSIGLVEHAHEGMQGYAVRPLGPILLLTNQPGEYILIPFLRAANTDLNVPLALALVSVFMTQVYGIRAMGWGYFYRFFNLPALVSGGMMKKMDFLVGLLEGVSEFAKIISFAFRLFGNIFAGMVLLAVISTLAPFLGPLFFYLLEVFVGFIQSFVFMMLTAAFIAVATAGHGDEHH